MPAPTAEEITTLRDADHASNLYMYVIRPPIAATATVNGPHDAAATLINITGWNNTKAIEPHYQVEITDAEGEVRQALFQACDIYPIPTQMSLSRNDLPALVGGESIVIKEYIPPGVLLPKLGTDWGLLEDNAKAYFNENIAMFPLARIGPSVAVARLRGGVATIKWHSDSMAPLTGETLTGHAWTFEEGDPASSSEAGTAESPIEVEYTTPGQHWVKYTVTASNGKTHTRYAHAVILDDEDNPPYQDSDFKLSNPRGDWESGYWDCDIEVYGDADVSEFPDLALVCLFARDYFDNVEQSIGGRWKHRENLVAVGYVVSGSVARDDEMSSTKFQLKGIAGITKELLSWPINLQSEGDAAWHVIPDMTFDKAAFHILTEHSTLDHIMDINFPSISKTLYSIDLPEADLYELLDDQLYSALRVHFVSSREGIGYFVANPQLLAEEDRPSTIVLDIDDQDWMGQIDLGDEAFTYKVSQVDFIGFGGTEDLTEYASLAPAGQHPTGKAGKVTGVRADDQDEANEIAGLWEAWRNNEFQRIRLTLKGNYRIFDIVRDEAVTLTMSAAFNNRGLDWDEVVCYMQEVEIEYEHLAYQPASAAPGPAGAADAGCGIEVRRWLSECGVRSMLVD